MTEPEFLYLVGCGGVLLVVLIAAVVLGAAMLSSRISQRERKAKRVWRGTFTEAGHDTFTEAVGSALIPHTGDTRWTKEWKGDPPPSNGGHDGMIWSE